MVHKMSKELEQTDPYYVNLIMTKGVIPDIECKLFGELRIVLFFAVKFFYL